MGSHPGKWLRSSAQRINPVDWNACINKTMIPLYIPASGTDNFDAKNVNDHVYQDLKLLEEYEDELKRQAAHSQFSDYYLNVESENK